MISYLNDSTTLNVTHVAGVGGGWWSGGVTSALAVYNTVLSTSEVAAITTAMQAI